MRYCIVCRLGAFEIDVDRVVVLMLTKQLFPMCHVLTW